MRFVDFHVHIDLYDNPLQIIEYYEHMGIYALFVTNLPEIFKKHLNTYGSYEYVRLALGYHPEMIDYYEFNEECFDTYFNLTNYIGEIGLDFSIKNELKRKKQIQIFQYICSRIQNEAKILSIHSRKAEKEVLEILIENNIKFAVFHWYTGSISYIDDIVNKGYYFSINYHMLNTKKGRQILANIPMDRILFETDGPFIRVNKKIISPEYIKYIYNEFNKFYGITNFKEIVYSNFSKLIKDRKNEEEKKRMNYNISKKEVYIV